MAKNKKIKNKNSSCLKGTNQTQKTEQKAIIRRGKWFIQT